MLHTTEIIDDSEWLAFCEFPGFAVARERFCLSTSLENKSSNPSTVEDLCSLLATVASLPRLSGELTRFALNVRSSRRHLFRRLSSDGQHGRTFVVARSAFFTHRIALLLLHGFEVG